MREDELSPACWLKAAMLTAGARNPPNGPSDGMSQLAHPGARVEKREPAGGETGELPSWFPNRQAPLSQSDPHPGPSWRFSLWSLPSLFFRGVFFPRRPRRVHLGKRPAEAGLVPPTEVGDSLPGEFLKQFIPFARDVSEKRTRTEPALGGIDRHPPETAAKASRTLWDLPSGG